MQQRFSIMSSGEGMDGVISSQKGNTIAIFLVEADVDTYSRQRRMWIIFLLVIGYDNRRNNNIMH